MKKRQPALEMGDLFAFPSESVETETASAHPPDHLERGQALDVTRSWIVEAPAGSGKTGLLIQRYLKLLALPSVEQPEQVLAITFTVKAAGEIRDRVLEQLQQAKEPTAGLQEFERHSRELALAVLDRDRMFGWDLLDHPRRFNIRTIDSICSEISRSLPVLSGSASLTPVEDASALYRKAAERTLLQLGGEDDALNDALRTVLLHRDGNLSQVRNLLAEMLSLRDQWGRLVPLGKEMLEEDYLDREVLPQIERTLVHVICQELSRIARLFPAPLLHEISTLAAEMGNRDGYKGEKSPIAICARLHHAPGETAEDLAHWRALAHLLVTSSGWRSSTSRQHVKFDIEKDHGKQLKGILEQLAPHQELCDALKKLSTLPPPQYPQSQWRMAKALFRILYRALAELQIVFAEQEECDFIEPSLVARSALRNEGVGLDASMGTQLQHLLVDEMQDTSTSQYDLIQLLTQGWDGHSQTIFLVGDPKQSIYLFRQARVERFIQTMQQQQLGGISLGRLYLTANFRSQELLVHSFNEDFSRLFPKDVSEDRPDEVPYVAAHPVRGRSSESQKVVWHTQSLPSDLKKEDRKIARRRQAQREALQVRAIIDQWHARASAEGREPEKIAVLVRNRAHLTEIAAELKRERGTPPIPYRAVKIEYLKERPEVLDLYALTRALLHPADRVAWLAVLRAPWCGLELAELHLLAGKDDPALFRKSIEELIVSRGQDLSEDSCQRLMRIWPVLQTAFAQRLRISLSQLVERTWRSLGGDLSLTREQRTNARMYFTLLDDLERHGAVDLSELDTRISSLHAETPATPGAVDLMTIHGAKGLEWDLVLIPSLERKSGISTARLLTWNEITGTAEHAASVLLAPIAGKGESSEALNKWLNSIQNVREQAEARRLFYVACTRAREELHLFASPEQKKDGGIKCNIGSLLQAAWPAAERHFVQAGSESSTTPVIPFPQPESDGAILTSLAAEADEPRRSILHRLPLNVSPGAQLRAVISWKPAATSSAAAAFKRPEGPFDARALGTAVHAFMELLAEEIAAGCVPQDLLLQVGTWNPRIAKVLHSYGLSPQIAGQLSGQVKAALTSALRDPVGLWILGSHMQAFSEQALTSWQEDITNLRLDRVFRAGPEPFIPGDSCTWVVDYKTTPCRDADVEKFLSHEQEKYAAQLETYGKTILAGRSAAFIRLGLYYPMIPAFRWWTMPDV
ncbi:exodeoxyribonuclease V subunit beta [Edaphobacter sp. 12200R-103]|uniref:UvrD-helicase domain-containing protein n=1 Tax=Edaphobacter sp. 12200R-103 TaxID=2703788 RepID=UPI00138DCB6D|nr:UvrD-helicase domain-containing protein [Edaphobacter sp. 12200R-103]QHS50935.1 UvrD-helicase domain-containing protein [Edaphobacter sp. 12200R-103]